MALTRKGYIVIGALVAGVVALGGHYLVSSGTLGHPTTVKSAVPVASTITHFQVPDAVGSYALPIVAKQPPVTNCPTLEELAWQAMGGVNLANGGAQTQAGSPLQKYTGGGCLNIQRQDDYGQMEANMAKFVSSGGSQGDGFISIMGDGLPYVAAALNKLIPGKFEVIGAFGFSDGEDKLMLPANWRDMMKNGQAILIAAVPRDGDWDIAVKFASDNGIKVNVDQKTVDPTAFNFMDVDAFTTADEKLISKACEDRVLISNGLAHGTQKVCVNGVATWTPGDVDVVQKYQGSIVGVASTHDYAGQMPAIIIGVKDWDAQHHDYIVGMIQAADRGAMAIRASNDGLMAMAQIHSQIFKEQTPDYWAKYFKGTTGQDQAGDTVQLGGSRVITLQEARDYFGMRAGTENIYASVYRVFKGYDNALYPTMFVGSDAIPEYTDIVNTSYLADALKSVPSNSGVVNTALAIAAPITTKVSSKSWHIEFDTGSANIKASSMDQLYAIEDTAAMTNLRMQMDGYTDNSGSDTINIPLSEQRAQAVAQWLNNKAPNNFPMSRMEARGHGSANPVCPGNDNATCKAQNRRVDIEMGQ